MLIQGRKETIKLDMFHCSGTLRVDEQDSHFLIHETQEEDDDRTHNYTGTKMDGAIQYGQPGERNTVVVKRN